MIIVITTTTTTWTTAATTILNSNHIEKRSRNDAGMGNDKDMPNTGSTLLVL